MTRLALTGGAYQARSVIASAQRCLNLYAEPVPQAQGEPAPMAYYPTPGLRLLATLPTGPVRGIRRTPDGGIYVVGGSVVYSVSPTTWVATAIGNITAGPATPVSMSDNGLQLVIVDGSSSGWSVALDGTNTFAVMDASVFQGADKADYLDTFLLFNVPRTPQFQSSLSLSTTFDPLFFANKESSTDLLVSIAVAKREIWLIGRDTSEVFYNSGAPDFPFASMPGVFIDHGCCAKYSVAEMDNAVFWLSNDRQGQGIVLKGAGYQAQRISKFAIEDAISKYSTISDAIGWTYQIAGHTCYVLTFPNADATWVYDISSQQWHEWCTIDNNGAEHRHPGNCAFFVNGTVVVGDHQSGNLYALDPAVFTDNGQPIKRQRAFPHLMADGRRVFYRQFIADMQTGTASGTTEATAPIVYLDWSDDRGASYGNPVAQTLGAAGQYRVSMQWQRLGMARDRVFRLTWTSPADTALQGAFIERIPASS